MDKIKVLFAVISFCLLISFVQAVPVDECDWDSCAAGFIRGDLNFNGEVTFIDALIINIWLFEDDSLIICQPAGDVDGDGHILINDSTYLLNHIFNGTPPPPAPYPDPGISNCLCDSDQNFGCPDDIRFGDVNNDTIVTEDDALSIVLYLQGAISTPGCGEAADVNLDGIITIEDADYITDWLYEGGPAVPNSVPACWN